ncbi:MAG: hypothetical protein HS130_00900 [Deltaproteobacteria bacterium]|nr:hypothetical protein [Deltaproteobacteria bacterium]
MSNLDTIKAIEDSLSAIVTAQGFMLEDSSTDKKLETKASCAIRHMGEEFGASHGDTRPNELKYARINFNEPEPGATRDRIAELCHKIRENVKVAALNVGALAASKLVIRVDHEGYDVTGYTPPITEMEYRLRVTYREE